MWVRDDLQHREPPAQLLPSLDLLLSHCLPEPHPWPEHCRLCGLLSQPCTKRLAVPSVELSLPSACAPEYLRRAPMILDAMAGCGSAG